MTATDQDEAAKESARELERRLRMVCPPSLLADAYAFAMAFKRWEMERDWRCLPKPPRAIELARQEGAPPDAHAIELEAAREAFAAASNKYRSKEKPDA